MTSMLADMRDCYRADFEQCLPEYPELVTEDEISFSDGVDDYSRYMGGWLCDPNFPDVPAYMEGWRWAENNCFGEFVQQPKDSPKKFVAGASFVLILAA